MAKSNLGFTLIELLVVVTIIAVSTGLSFAYYNNYSADKGIELEAKKLTDTLDLARKKALAGDAPNSCAEFGGYQVSVTSSTEYSLIQCCGVGGACDTAPIQSHTIGTSGVSLLPAAGTVTFLPLAAGATITGLSTIEVKNSTKCIKIDLTTTGSINMGDITASGC